MEYKISIIVPVYNAEKTLRRCVESIVCGTEKQLEVILVDDCSNDKSWDLCLELQEEFDNVRCIQNKQNKGVSYTRNQGISVSQSKWIAFVDSDDWVSQNYVSQLLSNCETFQDSLVICGFYYINKFTQIKKKYQFEINKPYIEFQGDKLFDLLDKTMLQSIWNKIFKREIINKGKVEFDETQSMGEDFRFVLDYMMAAGLQKCTVINESLYYYIRANNTSLMSNFGWNDIKYSIESLELLSNICGKNNTLVKQKLEIQIDNLKHNTIYHIVRNKNHTKKDKLNKTIEIVGKEQAAVYYRQQKISFYKENLILFISYINKLKNKVNSYLNKARQNRLIKNQKKLLINKDLTILSQNCIGGVFYHDMGLKFLSPTINLFFKEPDFIKFVNNLEYYINHDINIKWIEEYPIGTIDDINIYFMHYNNCKEAKEAWNRRKQRINYDNILILGTDRNGFTKDIYLEWKKIKYNKILFTVNKEFVSNTSVYFPEYSENNFVPDLIPKREFYKGNKLVQIINGIKE